MADIPLLGTLAPATGGSEPTTRGEYVQGVARIVPASSDRTGIPATMLRDKDLCLQADTGIWYQWSSGGASWSVYTGFGGSSLVDWKDSVRVATTANITLSGAQTIDGVSVIAGDRVLVKNQSTGSQNGYYVCAAGSWSRATDFDASAEVTTGATTYVEQGTANGGRFFILTTTGTITLGSTSLTFTALSTGSTVTAGNGLLDTGGTFSVQPEDATIAVGASGIKRAAITGDVAIAAGSNTSAIAANAVTTAKILDANVTLAKVADGAACSVVGRSANTSGVHADIASSADGEVFRRAGGVLGWGTIATAGIADNAVTLAKLATQAALSVLANATNATAVPTAVVAGTDKKVFLRSGTSLVFGDVDLTAAVTGLLPFANIANGSARSVLGRSANSSGVLAPIAGGGNGQILLDNGTTIGFAAPNFGALDVTTTGNMLLGAAPRAVAGTGLRTGASWQWSARNAANLADANVIGYGVAAADVIAIGDDTIGIEWTEVASGRNVCFFFKKTPGTTTDMPSATGDGVGFVYKAATEPTTGIPTNGFAFWSSAAGDFRTKGPGGGFKDVASGGVMHERHFEGTVTTTTTTANQTVLDIDTSGFGADVSGIAEITMTARGVAGTAGIAQRQSCYFSRTGGTLDAPGTLTVNGGATTDGTLSVTNSAALFRVRVTPAAATKRRWDVHVKLVFSNTDAV